MTNHISQKSLSLAARCSQFVIVLSILVLASAQTAQAQSAISPSTETSVLSGMKPATVDTYYTDTTSQDKSCSVDANLNCQAPSNIKELLGGGSMTWTSRGYEARKALFNSQDVQGSPYGCVSFAHLIKTECGIKFPVTAVFMAGAGKPIITSMVTGFFLSKSKEAGLSASFNSYFNRIPLPPSPPHISKIVGKSGQAEITFGNSTSEPSVPISGYEVIVYQDQLPGVFKRTTGTSSPITVTGLTNKVNYAFFVRARNSSGFGERSIPISYQVNDYCGVDCQKQKCLAMNRGVWTDYVVPQVSMPVGGYCTLIDPNPSTVIKTPYCSPISIAAPLWTEIKTCYACGDRNRFSCRDLKYEMSDSRGGRVRIPPVPPRNSRMVR